jgi:hypothetical protein
VCHWIQAISPAWNLIGARRMGTGVRDAQYFENVSPLLWIK